MIIDAHAHLGKWYLPIKVLSANEAVANLARLGIDAMILSSSLGIVYDMVEGNRELASAIQKQDRLWGYVSINFNYPQASLAELEKYLGQNDNTKFVGVKVHPLLAQHNYNTPDGMALTKAVAAYDVPILVHTFGTSAVESPWNVLPAAKANPNVPIILGHMGGNTWWEGVRVAREAPNLYLEICSTWTDPEKVRAAIDAVGPERVLFGTDATLFDQAYLYGAIADFELSAAEQELIMGENARRLFKRLHMGKD